jgi:hypothetical protein
MKKRKENVDEIDTYNQFHQHCMSSFGAKILLPKNYKPKLYAHTHKSDFAKRSMICLEQIRYHCQIVWEQKQRNYQTLWQVPAAPSSRCRRPAETPAGSGK